jgi:hypothetical protein
VSDHQDAAHRRVGANPIPPGNRTIEVTRRGAPVRDALELPLRVYSQVAMALARIVKELV